MRLVFAALSIAALTLTIGCDTHPSPASGSAASAASSDVVPTSSTSTTNSATTEGTCGNAACGGSCGGGASCGGGCGGPTPAAGTREPLGDAVWSTLKVAGMRCGGCANRIMAAVGSIDGVVAVRADPKTGLVRVAAAPDRKLDLASEVTPAITSLGYRVVR